MSETLTALGGIGLFLLGMKIMTEALREAAGANLRSLLARFTTTPLHGVASGAVTTAIIQSSSATTVMTVGFVGAGLLSFPQAIGVIYGANIGTTVTGWIISLIGLKLQLGRMAMGLLFVASLALLLSDGRAARVGRIAAGFCLLFIGLDTMQDAMQGAGGWITSAWASGTGLVGMFAMAALGLVITMVMQSSSAAIAVVLVLLVSGTMPLIQAASAVIGMNLGTTITALLAAIGGSRSMQQTSIANVLFNLGTMIIAFPILLIIAGPLEALAAHTGADTALVLFHTGFNVLGTLVFLPFTHQFAALVERIRPDLSGDTSPELDPRLLSDEGAAMQSARTVVTWAAREVFSAYSLALGSQGDLRRLSALEPRVAMKLEDLKAYMAKISIPNNKPTEAAAFAALMHQADHLVRLLEQSRHRSFIPVLKEDLVTRRPATWFAGCLSPDRTLDLSEIGERMSRMVASLAHRFSRNRRGLLLGEHAGIYSIQETFQVTDAMRWLTRVMHNVQRVGEYDAVVRDNLGHETPSELGT
ncbi:Na/Pi cotransporter family protein [Celeribacter litoreus]|uniref:Na/Pi cotransporter family protein n=1 Tax=Celeribacter litoreus TaxID=2876714 RepID=UPI001CCBFBCA|nr:Na/Pi symporter [Celeribacter litoreus]MCA0042632.1 Na/Pi symporter [Celeribacter litoreus]